MTAPDRTVPDAWDYALDLLAEDELEALARRPVEALDAELREAGVDPELADRLHDRALAQVYAEPPKPAARVVSLRPERPRAASQTGWLVLAAAAMLLAIGALEHQPLGQRMDAWLHPGPAAPAPTLPPPPLPHEPTPREQAEKLRAEAYALVAMGYVDPARAKLDEAQALDPAGEESVEVIDARIALERAKGAPTGDLAKPGVGPGERPLQALPRDR